MLGAQRGRGQCEAERGTPPQKPKRWRLDLRLQLPGQEATRVACVAATPSLRGPGGPVQRTVSAARPGGRASYTADAGSVAGSP